MKHAANAFAVTAPPPIPAFRTDDLVRALVANELDAIRDRLEDVGAELCMTPAVVTSHLESLQGIDELAQRSQNLALLLRADEMEGAIDAITLESLRNRLLDAVANYLAALAERGDSAHQDDPWTTI